MILLVGAGPMAQDYAKVLGALESEYLVIGRSESSAIEFEQATGKKVIEGGVSAYLKTKPKAPRHAIVSVGVEALAETTMMLIDYGVKSILVEKPAGINLDEIRAVYQKAYAADANVYVAYNRRFYSSVIKAQQIIKDDGGPSSFNFELTEWGHVIEKIDKPAGVKENWFLANTSHVSDLAFYLGGFPEQLSCFSSDSTSWHKRSANFAGAGRSACGALFSYNGNWNSPGRWSVEVLTKKHRLILRPMEQLQIQVIGSIAQNPVEIDDELDKSFKPGLYRQTQAFLNEDDAYLCDIEQQIKMTEVYNKMAGY